MSFVLEALKKQEAGIDPDAAVSLARSAAQHRRHRLWMGLFAVAMAVNAGLLLWMYGDPPATPSTAALPASPAGEAPAQPRPETPAAAPARVTPEAPPATALAEPAAPPRSEPERIPLGKLPPDARDRFPGIAFSTHIYAEDPELRAVVANGRRLTEGERIRGLEIVQITASGVVLAFENYRVEVPMVTDWDAL